MWGHTDGYTVELALSSQTLTDSGAPPHGHSRLGVAAVLAADAEVQVGAGLPAALHRNLDQLAHAGGVQLLRR